MNRFSVQHSIVFYILVCAISPAADAFDYQFTGFGSAGFSCVAYDHADFVIDDQPEGPGRTSSCDAGIDSMFGVQLHLMFNDALDFSLQAVLHRNSEGDFLPELTVAQLRWQPLDGLTLRFGRMPTPAFSHSDNRQVRYTMPWVRPTTEIYDLLPRVSSDGIEFIIAHTIEEWHAEWLGGITVADHEAPRSNIEDTFPVDAEGMFLNLTLSNANTRIKLGYLFGVSSIANPDANLILQTLRALSGQRDSALADDLEIDNNFSQMVSFGVNHDTEDWFVIGEFAYRSIGGYFRDQYGAYPTLGAHLGDWSPYTTVARRWTQGDDIDTRAGLLSQPVAALLAATRYDSTRIALGLANAIHDKFSKISNGLDITG